MRKLSAREQMAYRTIATLELERDALQQRLTERTRKHLRSCQLAIGKSQLAKELQQRLTVAEQALGGMLFAFDDGVGREWSAPLLDFARTITPAAEFVAALKPAAEG
ncbi:MAG: hypothetical protein J6D44_14750, partial [Pseudomonas sp.]|nr:hypothetical protein [Pseudomonas sp.]